MSIRNFIGSGRHRFPRRVQTQISLGSESPFIKCDCGEWKDYKTGEHAKSYSLDELLDVFKIRNSSKKCPNKKED